MEIDSKELEKQILELKTPIMVEFWSSWCPPCQMIKDILDELENEYEGKVKILKINSDMNADAVSKYGVKGLPGFIFFKNGNEVKREVGAKSKKELQDLLEEVITKL